MNNATPIHFSADNYHVVDFLITHGADIHSIDMYEVQLLFIILPFIMLPKMDILMLLSAY